MRGEHLIFRPFSGLKLGSSPHARGTLDEASQFSESHRFIPACAGNTPAVMPTSGIDSVHPRMRGEHEPGVPGPIASSRFIPACAGNTSGCRPLASSTAVHPRMRGEHRVLSSAHPVSPGSSPHARGTPPECGEIHPTKRFIPACAGNTFRRPMSSSRSTVHPRMRGEHAADTTGGGGAGGSSPHARGTPGTISTINGVYRFIPACAGNTRSRRSRSC